MYGWMSRCYRCSEKDPKTLIQGVRAIEHGVCARIYQEHKIYISDERALRNLYVCMYGWISTCYRCSEKDPKMLIRGVRAIEQGMCARIYQRVLSNLYAVVNFFTINI